MDSLACLSASCIGCAVASCASADTLQAMFLSLTNLHATFMPGAKRRGAHALPSQRRVGLRCIDSSQVLVSAPEEPEEWAAKRIYAEGTQKLVLAADVLKVPLSFSHLCHVLCSSHTFRSCTVCILQFWRPLHLLAQA